MHASDEMVEKRRNFILKNNLQFLELIRGNGGNLDRGGRGKEQQSQRADSLRSLYHLCRYPSPCTQEEAATE
jgi:hypothetical protein